MGSRKVFMWYRISLHGVPNMLGNFAWGIKINILGNSAWGTEYPRKCSIQDAVFPERVPNFLEGYYFSYEKLYGDAVFPGVPNSL